MGQFGISGVPSESFIFIYRGCQITPPRGFKEVCWTRPPVYEILLRENFCWTGQTAGWVFYFLYTLGKLAKRGGGWLPSGATRGCYPQGLLELSEILVQGKKSFRRSREGSMHSHQVS